MKQHLSAAEREIIEIHKWSEPLLPFIYHYDTVSAGQRYRGNWHDSLELLCVTSGSGILLCNRRHVEISAGTLAVIDSDAVHRVTSETEVRYHCLIISKQFCAENGVDISRLHFAPSSPSSDFLPFFDRISQLWKAHETIYRIPEIRAAVLSSLALLCRRCIICEDAPQDAPSDFIRTGLDYINRHYTEPLTLGSISAAVGISKYYFLREFKKYTDCTVTQYLNMLRCDLASSLLSETGAKVSAVAKQCGFDNVSYFSKTYKRYMGALPSAAMRGASRE